MGRVPTAKQVADLSRDEWEGLCRALVAIVFQANGVEDRKGKGNGLDSYRRDALGVAGWQYKRFDDRFETKQAAVIRSGVKLASERVLAEMGAPLKEYSLWANIDLEPGHGRKKGEIARFERLRVEVARDTGVHLDFFGLTRVHALLLKHPSVRPDLFEDVASQIAALREELRRELTDARLIKTPDGTSAAVVRLLEQANVHFARGLTFNSDELFFRAEESLLDARNLLVGLGADPALEARILVAQVAVHHRLGNLPKAEALGREALALLPDLSTETAAWARGNLGLVLAAQQRYDEADLLLRGVLAFFEADDRQVEVVRTLTNLLELELNRKNIAAAAIWGERVEHAAARLDATAGVPSEVTLAALGALASGLIWTKEPELLRHAEQVLYGVQAKARGLKIARIWIPAMTQRAQALWFMDDRDQAAALYTDAIEASDKLGMAKQSADCAFNLALVTGEKNKEMGVALMKDASQRYAAIGDAASQADAEQQLAEWRR